MELTNKKYFFTGLAVGSLSGLLGIGGGVILVPLLVSYLNFPQHRAHAVSLAVVLPVAVAGALIYGFHGDTDLAVGIQIAVGSMVGASVGAKLMQKIPAETLKKIFALLLIVVGIRMLIS